MHARPAGDLVPSTAGQRLFVTFAMLGGALLYGYIIGTVSALLSSANEQKHRFVIMISQLNAFLEQRRVPHALCMRLRAYVRCQARLGSGPGATIALAPRVATRRSGTEKACEGGSRSEVKGRTKGACWSHELQSVSFVARPTK